MLPFYIQEEDPPAKREILRAAMKLFSKHGLAGTSIRDIAQESGYTNPALYKHFGSKEEMALFLFEACHRRLWTTCHRAIEDSKGFDAKLEAYVGQVLELFDQHPDVMAFLSDSARVLWPLAGTAVKRHTMIDLARSLMHSDVAAASLQGTLAELARMIQVGAVKGPATRWKPELVALFRKISAA
jgi:AcrR family transcriptional regulator